MTKTVVAIFNSIAEAQNAATQLQNNGFSSDMVDVSSGKTYADHSDNEENGISRFFRNLFGNSDDERERYTKVAERGSMVTVHATSEQEADRASELLDDYGAVDVDENYREHISRSDKDDAYDTKDGNYNYNMKNENYENGGGVRDSILDTTDDNYVDEDDNYLDRNTGNDLNENKIIPVIQEDIKIGKKEVTTGGMRIRSRIIEKPVEENLRLREEYVNIERNKVDRPATEEELSNFKNSTVELTASAEIPDIQKTSKVVEEVSLGKEVKHRDETIRDNVRQTEVDVEDIEPGNRDSRNRNL